MRKLGSKQLNKVRFTSKCLHTKKLEYNKYNEWEKLELTMAAYAKSKGESKGGKFFHSKGKFKVEPIKDLYNPDGLDGDKILAYTRSLFN